MICSMSWVSLQLIAILHLSQHPVLTLHSDTTCSLPVAVTALIPARAASKGIVSKNLAQINNQTLLSRTIRLAFASKVFKEVWVSTDGKEIAKEAWSAGAQIHWRSSHTATDHAPTLLTVQEFLDFRQDVNHLAVIQCTSPFLCSAWLSLGVDMLTKGADCAFAVTTSHKLRWKKTEGGFVEPENFNSSRRPRRQDWSGDLVETGMFYITNRALVQSGNLQNNRCQVVEVPSERALEIDTPLDLEIARAVLPLLPPCN